MARLRHKVRKKVLRKEFRENPIPGHHDYGDGIDHGKYFRCANCGMVCDIDRDEIGELSNVSADNYTQEYSTDGNDAGGPPGAKIHGEQNNVALIRIATLRTGHVIMENGSDGEPKTIRLSFKPNVSSGCPFCGSVNWLGKG